MKARATRRQQSRRSRRVAALLALVVGAAVAAACHSEPDAATSAQTARLELKPRASSFRDIGKRGDSDLGAP